MAAAAADDDDLDQLLDSALDEFTKLDIDGAASTKQREGKSPQQQPVPVQFSASSSSSRAPGVVQGLGMPDLKVRKKGKQRAPTGPTMGKVNYASEALEKLTRETRAALREIESVTASGEGLGSGMPKAEGGSGGPSGAAMDDAALEEFVKQFEEFSGSQDMDSIVESMMQQLLSKDMLHEPMREIVERYPKWLDENRSKLSSTDYERYSRQYELMRQLNEIYDNDPNNFTQIVDTMQKIQECGNPPDNILREIVPDLDLNNMGPMSAAGLSGVPKCCVMSILRRSAHQAVRTSPKVGSEDESLDEGEFI